MFFCDHGDTQVCFFPEHPGMETFPSAKMFAHPAEMQGSFLPPWPPHSPALQFDCWKLQPLQCQAWQSCQEWVDWNSAGITALWVAICCSSAPWPLEGCVPGLRESPHHVGHLLQGAENASGLSLAKGGIVFLLASDPSFRTGLHRNATEMLERESGRT